MMVAAGELWWPRFILVVLMFLLPIAADGADSSCSSSLVAPRVVIGCWQILERAADEAQAVETLAEYAKAGFTTFDTADIYGRLGSYPIREAAAYAYDEAAKKAHRPASCLNYVYSDYVPLLSTQDGHAQHLKRNPNRVGKKMTGVKEKNGRFYASIQIKGQRQLLGTHSTIEGAALAHDQAAMKAKRPSKKLNFVHSDYVPLLSTQDGHAQHLKRNPNRVGKKMTGVREHNGRFQANIKIKGQQKNLGTHSTIEGAALAYDQAAMKAKHPSTTLNFVHSGNTET